MPLPTEGKERKTYPIYEGFVKFFPDAIACVAHRSFTGSEQHHPGEPVQWNREYSADEPDAMLRHMLDGEWDAMAWRAMAHLQKMYEEGWRP